MVKLKSASRERALFPISDCLKDYIQRMYAKSILWGR
jgi:hypothetical protein